MQSTPLQEFGLFIIVFFPVLALTACCLRLYSKKKVGQLGLDDLCVVIATAMSVGETYTTWMYMRTNFVGWHYFDIPKGAFDFVIAMKYNFAVQVLYNPILAIVKTSVLLFLLKLCGQRNDIRYTIYALNTLNLMLMVAIFITVIFQCTPIEANWWTPEQIAEKGGHCIKQGAFYVATAAITILTDILVLAIPFWIVIGLKMARKTKFAVIGIFFLGFVVTMVGVGRLIILVQAFFPPLDAPPNPDYTYNLGFCTSAIETNLAIVTACAPALKPLFRTWFPRLFSSAHSKGNPYSSGPYVRNSRYANGSRRDTATAGLRSGHGGYAMKDMKGHTEIGSENRGGSEEEIMTMNGIMKTTDVTVNYMEPRDDRSSAKSKTDYGMRTSVDSTI